MSNWPPSPAVSPAVPPLTFGQKVNRFWLRVTEGLELNQLWSQFEKDARASYRLYARDLEAKQDEVERPGRKFVHVAQKFFWAVLEKLTPARRLLLLVALVLLIFNPEVSWHSQGNLHVVSIDFRLLGGLLLFLLLILEVADRVVMKRDLQIAREIQGWLLPNEPPAIPGIEIAFQTRPANTVAGDYYDVFTRPGPNARGQARPDRSGRCRGQEHSCRALDGDVSGEPAHSLGDSLFPAGTGRKHQSVRVHQQPRRPALHHGVPF